MHPLAPSCVLSTTIALIGKLCLSVDLFLSHVVLMGVMIADGTRRSSQRGSGRKRNASPSGKSTEPV